MKKIIDQSEDRLNALTGGVQACLGKFKNYKGEVMWDDGKHFQAYYPDKYNAQPIVNLN